MSAEAKEPGGLVPGRIVHYYPRREDIRRAGRLVNADRFVCPAMVTQVLGTPIQLVDLTVFGLGTPFEVAGVPYDESGRVDGAWHWMFEGQENRYRSDPPSEMPKLMPEGVAAAQDIQNIQTVLNAPADGFHYADPWEHRSAKMRCETCMWFVRKEGSVLGRCRINAPTTKGFVPVYESDWCGQHRLDENKA